MQVQHQQNVESVDKMRASVEESSARLADSKRGREGDDGERPTKLLRLSKNAQERQALQQEVETLKENDPQALADLEKELKLATEGANRWTDNIFNCKSYLTKKRGMDNKGACQTLGITSAFDCKCIVVGTAVADIMNCHQFGKKVAFVFTSLFVPRPSPIFVELVDSTQMRRTRSPNRGRRVVASQ
jgi:hypothetical protein